MVDLKKGDCLELMSEIPNKSVDLILCDLPYGTTANKWDSVIPMEPLWKQYKRIIKDNGAILLFSQLPFGANLIMLEPKLFRYEWIYQKTCPTGFLLSKKMPLRAHENILVFYKHLPTYNPLMRTGFKPYVAKQGSGSSNYGNAYSSNVVTVSNGDRYPIDILEYAKDNEKYHPTLKPVALLEYMIKTYTNEGEVVLDNCMGSGSTGVAAVNTGRDFIGYELDDEYFKIAQDRINKALESNA